MRAWKLLFWRKGPGPPAWKGIGPPSPTAGTVQLVATDLNITGVLCSFRFLFKGDYLIKYHTLFKCEGIVLGPLPLFV